jgi:site-specific recombinase XerD
MPIDWKQKKTTNPGHQRGKTESELVLLPEQVEKILRTIENGPAKEHKKIRDYYLVFISYMLGLRISEAAILDRSTFRDVVADPVNGLPLVKTLKRSERIPIICTGCGRSSRVAANRDGKIWKCRHCLTDIQVRRPRGRYVQSGPPEISPPEFPTIARKKTLAYLAAIPAEQHWLFVGGDKTKHLHEDHISKIFSRYVALAGLSSKYSFHSLRHGMGSYVWDKTLDQKAVQDTLRQKDLKSSERYMHLNKRSKEKLRTGMDADFKGFDS